MPSVKPLAWTINLHRGDETHCAESILGRYAAWVAKDVAYAIVPGAWGRTPAGTTLEDAKRHCQEDFASRILSALEV